MRNQKNNSFDQAHYLLEVKKIKFMYVKKNNYIPQIEEIHTFYSAKASSKSSLFPNSLMIRFLQSLVNVR
jgi:hypothetical protein